MFVVVGLRVAWDLSRDAGVRFNYQDAPRVETYLPLTPLIPLFDRGEQIMQSAAPQGRVKRIYATDGGKNYLGQTPTEL